MFATPIRCSILFVFKGIAGVSTAQQTKYINNLNALKTMKKLDYRLFAQSAAFILQQLLILSILLILKISY